MEPSVSGCDDRLWVGSPDEWLGCFVVFVDEAVDGGLEIDDGSEDAVLQPTAHQDGKEAFDGVQPRAGGRRKVERPAGMAIEPDTHLVVLVGRVVVEDDVDDLAGRDVALKGIEEADELLMPVALHVLPEHLASQDIERGEQRGRSVALVVVGHSGATPLLQRQPRLCAIEGLDLGLFIEAEDDGMSGRADVEPDNVVQFLDEGWIARELEPTPPMGS